MGDYEAIAARLANALRDVLRRRPGPWCSVEELLHIGHARKVLNDFDNGVLAPDEGKAVRTAISRKESK